MIPIPADHAADVIDGNLLPGLWADMLPPWDFLQDQKSNFIAAIEKVPRLGIMRCPHDVAMKILPQNDCILPLYARGHRLADKWKRLMTVEASQLDDLPVER